MKKHLNKIVIAGVVIILVFVFLIIRTMMNNNNENNPNQQVPAENTAEAPYNTDDYVISNSVQLYPDTDAQLGDFDSRILGLVESYVIENDEVTGINISDKNGNSYNLLVEDMNLISLEYDGANEVNLNYRTGGYARMVIGSYVYLYKDENGNWSLDERVQFGGTVEKQTGTVTDFEFATMSHQKGHILVSYIVLDIGNSQTVKLPMSAVNTQSIMSSGQLTIYYTDDAGDGNMYAVNEGDDFGMQVTMHDGSDNIYQKGSQISIQKSSKKGYWELGKNIDASRYRAIVTDIVFGHDKQNITGVDYIVVTKDNGTQEYLTLMQTQAHYGKPYGNYMRTYVADGNDMVIGDVDPNTDFRMELYYPNDTKVMILVGAEVWISKNSDDIFVLDYEYTYSMQDS